jgi:hypothetical protein
VNFRKQRWLKRRAGGEAPPVIDGDNRRITGGEPPDKGDPGARDEFGRFVPGTAAGAATRFNKGRSGNPNGRPKGSGRFRAGTRAAALLLDARAEALAEKAIEMALDGDAVAVRFCLGRLLGVRRGQPVELDLPAIAAPRDLAGVVGAIAAAVASGSITPDEALALAQMVDGFPRVLAAGAPERPLEPSEDPREAFIRELDRIAALEEAEERARPPEPFTLVESPW